MSLSAGWDIGAMCLFFKLVTFRLISCPGRSSSPSTPEFISRKAKRACAGIRDSASALGSQ